MAQPFPSYSRELVEIFIVFPSSRMVLYRGGKEVAEAALGKSMYDLATATVELLGTLAAHGASAEVRGIGMEAACTQKNVSGVDRGRGTGGNRWTTEIAIGFGDADGSGGALSGGGRVGGNVKILDACWKVSTDVDGRHGEGVRPRQT